MSGPDANLASFERAAELCQDLTPLVDARLLQAYPDLEAHFWREPRKQIQGEMLAKVIEAILDFNGERRYADVLIRSVAITHAGYDVAPADFRVFFGVLAQSLRRLLKADWSPRMEAVWEALLMDLESFI